MDGAILSVAATAPGALGMLRAIVTALLCLGPVPAGAADVVLAGRYQIILPDGGKPALLLDSQTGRSWYLGTVPIGGEDRPGWIPLYVEDPVPKGTDNLLP